MINYIRYFIYKLGLSFEHKFVFLNQRANALPLCHYNIFFIKYIYLINSKYIYNYKDILHGLKTLWTQ